MHMAKEARNDQASKCNKMFQYYLGSRHSLKIGLYEQYMNFCATSWYLFATQNIISSTMCSEVPQPRPFISQRPQKQYRTVRRIFAPSIYNSFAWLCSPPSLTHSANSCLCLLMSMKLGRLSRTLKGFPTKSLSTSPSAFIKPFAPSRSILPAQTRHCIGRNSGVPNTKPRQTIKIDTMVSIDMSIGREAVVVTWEEVEDRWAVPVDCRAECSWAE